MFLFEVGRQCRSQLANGRVPERIADVDHRAVLVADETVEFSSITRLTVGREPRDLSLMLAGREPAHLGYVRIVVADGIERRHGVQETKDPALHLIHMRRVPVSRSVESHKQRILKAAAVVGARRV